MRWEVCWQLGGIYTVLRTKAVAMLERWGDRYCLIGPYNPATAPIEFEEKPAEGAIKRDDRADERTGDQLLLRPMAHRRPAPRDPHRLPRAIRQARQRQVPHVGGPRHHRQRRATGR